MLVKVANKDIESSSRRWSSSRSDCLRALPVADLGQRQRACRPSAPDLGRRGRSLFSWPSVSLAARVKRKHQQIAVSVSSARNRSVFAQPGQAECHRKAAQWKAQKDLAL